LCWLGWFLLWGGLEKFEKRGVRIGCAAKVGRPSLNDQCVGWERGTELETGKGNRGAVE
jgi:hypothetical protein